MYFNIVLVVFVSFLAAIVGAQEEEPQWPIWNITFYSDKNCKDGVATAQVNRNVTCDGIAGGDPQIWSFFPVGPKTFGKGGNANYTVYTTHDCPRASVESSQLANFNTCNTATATLHKWDMYIFPGDE
ncbi:hypothetical protein F4805DRAFT_476539 [Annulohypoxylon moriforme]|nr:hypothetical protein F4805DRAFT_476539 [Annulohypoxylon moriforme]